MGSPVFTVVLTTYNRPRFLERAVASVLAQTVDDWELLLVDDAGPQQAEPTANDPRIRLVRREKNGGLAASRNTGIEHAQGTYITFLDDDDLYMPDRLELVLPALKQAPVAVCWSRYFFERAPGNNRLLSGGVHDRILDAITPHAGATTIHRDHLLYFDESFQASQDVEWWIRLSARTEVATAPRVGYLIRQHQGIRHRNTRRARIDASIRMLNVEYAGYFDTHPTAAGLRWKRVGLQALADHDYVLARRAFLRSFRHRRDPRSMVHLGRAIWRQVRRFMPLRRGNG